MNSRFLCFVWFIFFLLPLEAQKNEPVPVDKAEEIVLIDGQKFWLHKVKAGQTIYSLSKAYDVRQDAIIAANPKLKDEGLKTEMVVKIPVAEKGPEELEQSWRFFYHVIKPGETLYSLARRFGVKLGDLYKHNPDIEENDIQVGQKIKILKRKAKDEELIHRSKRSDFYFHEVERKETLYSLAKFYGVKIDSILKYNPEVRKEGLQTRQVLKVPRKKPDVDSVKVDSVKPDSLITEEALYDCDTFRLEKERPLEVVFFLPFYAERSVGMKDLDGEDSADLQQKTDQYIYPGAVNAVEFYQGALLAFDEWRAKGIDVNVKFFDTRKDTLVLKRMIRKIDFSNTDLIIGPAFSSCFDILAREVEEYEIPVVSPFSDNNDLVEKHPMAFQVNPSLKTKVDSTCRYISQFQDSLNMIMVYSTHIADYDLVNEFKSCLLERDLILPDSLHKMRKLLSISSKNDSQNIDSLYLDSLVTMISYYDTLDWELRRALSKYHENLIFIPSERETLVGSIVSRLRTLSNLGYKIRIIGLPGWNQFRNIDLQDYYDLRMTFATPFFFDFNEPAVVDITRKYRNYFYNDLYKVTYDGYNFTLMGYDIVNWFFSGFKNYGRQFYRCLDQINKPVIQTNYRFVKKKSDVGYENIRLQFYQYKPDMKLIKLAAPFFIKEAGSPKPKQYQHPADTSSVKNKPLYFPEK